MRFFFIGIPIVTFLLLAIVITIIWTDIFKEYCFVDDILFSSIIFMILKMILVSFIPILNLVLIIGLTSKDFKFYVEEKIIRIGLEEGFLMKKFWQKIIIMI